MMPAVPALRISRPHGNTTVLLWKGGESIQFFSPPDGWCFAKHRLSGMNTRKGCRRFLGSSAAVIAMTS